MAFKRTSFSALKKQKKEFFESIYKFSKKVPNFKEGSDVYVIPLGLSDGFFETPCHRVMPHKVDGQTIGFGGTSYATYIKCSSVHEDGSNTNELCCQLAAREKQRCGDDYNKRIISGCSSRIHLPILILGNSLGDDSKSSYPITKVAILKDYRSEAGLKFSYLDMSSSSFRTSIIEAYGRKLKEDGVLDYEMDEDGEEFLDEIRNRLSKTIIKVHGVSKNGFSVALKEYSFFPLDNPTVASGSGEEEQKAVKLYYKHKGIVAKIDEYLQLFNIEVENLIKSYNEKDLLEYYNSAIGLPLNSGIEESALVTADAVKTPKVEEKVEIIESEVSEDSNDGFEDDYEESAKTEPASDKDMQALLEDPFEGEDPVEDEPVLVGATANNSGDDSLDSFEFDSEIGGEDFFGE